MPIYMKIDGVKGQVMTKSFEDTIALESASFGTSREISSFTGTAREVSSPRITDMAITKVHDSSSTALFRNSLYGDAFPEVEVFFCRDKGGGEVEAYLSVKMELVLVTSYQVAGTSQGDAPVESLTLNFLKVTSASSWRGSDYGAGGEDDFGYDMQTMSAL